MIGWDAHTIERELGRWRASDAHLVLQAGHAESPGVGRDDEGRQVPVARSLRIRDCKDDHQVRHAALADEALFAADDVFVSLPRGASPNRGRVRARLRFGEGKRDELPAGGQVGQPACFLLLSSDVADGQRRELLDRKDQTRGRARAGDLLDREADGQEVSTDPAVLRRER